MNTVKLSPFIAFGVGRCGTTSLAMILRECCNTTVLVEDNPYRVSWYNPNLERLEAFAQFLEEGKGLIGSVARYWLPHIEYMRLRIPKIKLICLHRPKEETVASWLGWKGKNVSRLRPGRGNKHDTYPIIDACDVKQSYEFYWEMYEKWSYAISDVYHMDMEHLNSHCRIDALFDYLEILPEDRRYLENTKFNMTIDIEKYYRHNIPSHEIIVQEQRQAQTQHKGPTIEKNGRVSIVMLGCKRLHLLRQTCKALFSHIDQHESALDVEYILVDNGSGKKVINYAKSVRFNKVIANAKNLGIARGLNQGFSAATGEFVFQLEDDWLCNTDLPLIRMSIEVLREFDDIGLIRLKQTELQKMGGRNIGVERQTKTGTKFWPWYPTKLPCGSYCFGCGIFKRQAYLYTGPIPTDIHPRATELAYARMFEKFYSGARVEGLLEAFVHTGGGQKSSGWGDKI